MSKQAFGQILEGLNEALAFARGELKAKLHAPAASSGKPASASKAKAAAAKPRAPGRAGKGGKGG